VYDDGSRPGKPAPDIYLHAAHTLGLPPANCVVVEDSVSGLQAAHAAGIGHIVALGPPPTHERLRQTAGVCQVIPSLQQIHPDTLFR
jgi:beta-phosphoglucomutase-like phosphatase (HAD superfamily)